MPAYKAYNWLSHERFCSYFYIGNKAASLWGKILVKLHSVLKFFRPVAILAIFKFHYTAKYMRVRACTCVYMRVRSFKRFRLQRPVLLVLRLITRLPSPHFGRNPEKRNKSAFFFS